MTMNWLTALGVCVLLSLQFKLAQAAEPDEQLRKLLQARLEVATEDYQFRQAMYERGKAAFEDVAAAGRRSLESELELATSRQQRIAIHEKQLQLALQVEQHAKAKVEAGVSSRTDLLEATYHRLGIEIELHRLKKRENDQSSEAP